MSLTFYEIDPTIYSLKIPNDKEELDNSFSSNPPKNGRLGRKGTPSLLFSNNAINSLIAPIQGEENLCVVILTRRKLEELGKMNELKKKLIQQFSCSKEAPLGKASFKRFRVFQRRNFGINKFNDGQINVNENPTVSDNSTTEFRELLTKEGSYSPCNEAEMACIKLSKLIFV
ncbi:hypothetical protein Mgra_00000719 [Meloidogyne graminicola]|uniref:Uncharacterized protein n=1 Tax=Meloidogyne graminicola TaxID=189291 RepID=A0A8T0A3A5_9BILA|nr:hypothetical protein Mgra_00000719 [Meloidogyne graminicola]